MDCDFFYLNNYLKKSAIFKNRKKFIKFYFKQCVVKFLDELTVHIQFLEDNADYFS